MDALGTTAPDADHVLQRVSEFLRKRLRSDDVPCRYGGEEIALVVSGASLRDTLALAERLRAGIECLDIQFDARTIAVTASFGVAAFPEHGMSPELLVRAADSALYMAKSAGRNRVFARPI